MFLRASKNNSKNDLRREQEMLDDVVNIRKGKILNLNSNLGKLYLGAFAMIFLFPIVARLIDRFGFSSKAESNILLFVGYVIIIVFIIGMIYMNKSNRNN